MPSTKGVIKGVNGYYTYLFRDPRTGSPFYVGKGCGVRARASGSRSKEVRERITQILSSGLLVITEIANVPTESDAFWFEKDLIASLGRMDQGTGPLLNHSNGGDGCFGRQSDDGRKAIAKSMAGNRLRLGKKFTEEELQRIRAGVRRSMTPQRLEQLRLAGLKGSKRSAELGLNKLGGTHSGAFQKGRRPHKVGGYSNF